MSGQFHSIQLKPKRDLTSSQCSCRRYYSKQDSQPGRIRAGTDSAHVGNGLCSCRLLTLLDYGHPGWTACFHHVSRQPQHQIYVLTFSSHSIIGGVIGVGIATLGAGGVSWGWKGVSQVFAAWVIAPGIAGAFGALIFLVTKYGVMTRKNPVLASIYSIPFYFALTAGILTSESWSSLCRLA